MIQGKSKSNGILDQNIGQIWDVWIIAHFIFFWFQNSSKLFNNTMIRADKSLDEMGVIQKFKKS